MLASTAFSKREEILAQQLMQAESMDQAVSTCTMCMEQVACELAQDEQDEHARQRQQAVLAVLRRVPQILMAVKAKGELVVGNEIEDKPKTGLNCVQTEKGIGVALLAVLAIYELIGGHILFALIQIAGSALLLLTRKTAPALPTCSARSWTMADGQSLIRTLRELMQAVDIGVSDLILLEKETGCGTVTGTVDDAVLDMMSVLMEAKASGRENAAIRSLAQAEQYLRMMGITAHAYDAEHERMFDVLPTLGESRTIRPALVQEGKILRRGVAALSTQTGRTMNL